MSGPTQTSPDIIKSLEKEIAKEGKTEDTRIRDAAKDLSTTEKAQRKAHKVKLSWWFGPTCSLSNDVAQAAMKAETVISKMEKKETAMSSAMHKATHDHDVAATELHGAQKDAEVKRQQDLKLKQELDTKKANIERAIEEQKQHNGAKPEWPSSEVTVTQKQLRQLLLEPVSLVGLVWLNTTVPRMAKTKVRSLEMVLPMRDAAQASSACVALILMPVKALWAPPGLAERGCEARIVRLVRKAKMVSRVEVLEVVLGILVAQGWATQVEAARHKKVSGVGKATVRCRTKKRFFSPVEVPAVVSQRSSGAVFEEVNLAAIEAMQESVVTVGCAVATEAWARRDTTLVEGMVMEERWVERLLEVIGPSRVGALEVVYQKWVVGLGGEADLEPVNLWAANITTWAQKILGIWSTDRRVPANVSTEVPVSVGDRVSEKNRDMMTIVCLSCVHLGAWEER
ncbi:hypothetical protein DXG03_005320 [Asterophora parasitica]|uniref:Uncharacterized protein n=1 Tax=Asterophora parasitica TaxID=117018 RepID=A0A9P7GBP7_9AGAR|nr:hypothetical protein DXG03_005320 [Asterophora parasitica]